MTSSRSSSNNAGVHRSRFFLVRGLVVFLFALLGARLVYVQGVLRTELQQRAGRSVAREENRTGRLRILDRNLATLAETVPVYSCYVDPSIIRKSRANIRDLAALLEVDGNALARRVLRTKGSFLWVKRRVPLPTVSAIRAKKLRGVGFRLETRRNYPMGPLASHLLGFVGLDGHGLSGLERAFEACLDDNGIAATKASVGLPKGTLVLSIDARVQKIAEKELEWGARKINAKSGMAVVQDPWTGDILAMASWPAISLDPDRPPKSKEMRIPAIADVFEPGSTFKLVTAAAAIEEKAVRPNELFSGENGAWKVATIKIHDHEPRKLMNLTDIMVYSSNVGTAKVGERLGSEKLFQYARLFGFGVFPGSGIAGEARGLLRLPSKWSGTSRYVVSFGQEVGVTALQLVGAYSAIANGGTLMEPRIVKQIISDDGAPLWQSQPATVRRIVSKETAASLTRMLTEVVERGTATAAQIQWSRAIRVAGKTGTAQKFDLKMKRYHPDHTLVSFCGFFPADNPKLTMLVLLDEPEGRRWGGTDAAPVFRRIAEQLLPSLELFDEKNLAARPAAENGEAG